jgi:hypothetical protein
MQPLSAARSHTKILVSLPFLLVFFNAQVIDMCFGPQMNRRVVLLALNGLFTGDPEKNPALAKVLQSVRLDGKKPILHRDHPDVVSKEEILSLCTLNTALKNLCALQTHSSQCPVHKTCKESLFFHKHFIGSFGICILNFFVVNLDRAYSSTRSKKSFQST